MQDNAVIWVGGRAAGKNMNLKGGGGIIEKHNVYTCNIFNSEILFFIMHQTITRLYRVIDFESSPMRFIDRKFSLVRTCNACYKVPI